jgi:hypothetical protein
MRRVLFNAFALLCLVAAVAAVVLGVRSYRFTKSEMGESLNFRRHDPRWWIISHRGTFTLCRQNGKEWGKEFGNVEGLGFRFGGLKGPDGSLWNLAVPYWFVATAGMVPPALWLVAARRRRKRVRAGLCLRCGYDLRANAGGRCPECGEAVDVSRGFAVG